MFIDFHAVFMWCVFTHLSTTDSPSQKRRIVLMIYDNIVLAADKWRRQICLLYFFRLKENPTFVKSLVSVIFLLKFNIFAGVTLLPPEATQLCLPDSHSLCWAAISLSGMSSRAGSSSLLLWQHGRVGKLALVRSDPRVHSHRHTRRKIGWHLFFAKLEQPTALLQGRGRHARPPLSLQHA